MSLSTDRSSPRSFRSRNLLFGKVLLIKVKLRSSSFVRGAFVVQVNPIKFEEFGGKVADAVVQNAAIRLARPKRHKRSRNHVTWLQ